MSKQIAELYRQLADKIDEIEALKMQLDTEKQIRQTTQDQLNIANTQIKVLNSQVEEHKTQIESFKLQTVQWHEKSTKNSDILDTVKNVFSKYSVEDFDTLESEAWEAKGLISSEDYDTMDDYYEEIDDADIIISLAEELRAVKEVYFNDSEGEESEVEQLIEF